MRRETEEGKKERDCVTEEGEKSMIGRAKQHAAQYREKQALITHKQYIHRFVWPSVLEKFS